MFFACGIWCVADVLNVSPSSRHIQLTRQRRKNSSFFIINFASINDAVIQLTSKDALIIGSITGAKSFILIA